jgi:hypothetical protein
MTSTAISILALVLGASLRALLWKHLKRVHPSSGSVSVHQEVTPSGQIIEVKILHEL